MNYNKMGRTYLSSRFILYPKCVYRVVPCSPAVRGGECCFLGKEHPPEALLPLPWAGGGPWGGHIQNYCLCVARGVVMLQLPGHVTPRKQELGFRTRASSGVPCSPLLVRDEGGP